MSDGNVARDTNFFWNMCWNDLKFMKIKTSSHSNRAAFVGKKDDFKVEGISEPDKTVKGIQHHQHHQFNDFPVKVSDGGDGV